MKAVFDENCSRVAVLNHKSRLFVLALLLTFVPVACAEATPNSPIMRVSVTEGSATVASPQTPSPTPAPVPARGPMWELEEIPLQAVIEAFFGPLPYIQDSGRYRHVPVRALYIGNGARIDEHLKLIEGTVVNALVIDAKESFGLNYQSKVPLAQSMDACVDTQDLAAIFQKCRQKGVRAIARIVCFKDEKMAEARPDFCIRTQEGVTLHFPNEGGHAFADPYKREVWHYLLDIAREVIDLGADEIQFDYVRFPSGAAEEGEAYFGEVGQTPERYQAIIRFLQTAGIEIQRNLGVPVGADIFSIVLTSEPDGERLGQSWKHLGRAGIDNICPMLYPSHYANTSRSVMGNGVGQFIGGELFRIPDLKPGEVVAAALRDGKEAMKQSGFSTVRTYLQAFTATYLAEGYYQPYGEKEIIAQIKALQEAGLDEWILWNPRGDYPRKALEPAQ